MQKPLNARFDTLFPKGEDAFCVFENADFWRVYLDYCAMGKNRELAVLRNFPNVVVTPHMAFYTDQATDDMVHHSVLSCLARLGGKEDPWKIL